MMSMLLSNCASAWGIEKQEELHDAAEEWKKDYARTTPLMQRHLEHLQFLCGDISCLSESAIEFIKTSDLIFCNNFLFGSLETTYKRYLSVFYSTRLPTKCVMCQARTDGALKFVLV